jgi:integrase
MNSAAIILQGESYRNFIETLSSRYSKKMYKHILIRYMSFCGVTDVNDLFFKADVKYTQSRIIDFVIFLKEKNQMASRSRSLFLTALKHFYDMNDVSGLNWKKIRSFVGEIEDTVEDRPYTREEIAKLLEKAKERERVMILLMCSAGMREGAIHTLKLSNLTKIEKYKIYKIMIYGKSKEKYYSFCTPECASAIDNYLQYRKRYGETLNGNSPLIREEFNKLDPFHAAKPRFLSSDGIRWIMSKLINDSGLREKEKGELVSLTKEFTEEKKKYKRYELMQSHGLRKFFETETVRAGMNPLYASILMGHDNGLETKYFKPTENDLLEGSDKMVGYIGVMDYLTINEENRLKRELAELRIKTNDIQDLKNELDELRSLISSSKK